MVFGGIPMQSLLVPLVPDVPLVPLVPDVPLVPEVPLVPDVPDDPVLLTPAPHPAIVATPSDVVAAMVAMMRDSADARTIFIPRT
jgi:hypothetical protein